MPDCRRSIPLPPEAQQKALHRLGYGAGALGKIYLRFPERLPEQPKSVPAVCPIRPQKRGTATPVSHVQDRPADPAEQAPTAPLPVSPRPQVERRRGRGWRWPRCRKMFGKDIPRPQGVLFPLGDDRGRAAAIPIRRRQRAEGSRHTCAAARTTRLRFCRQGDRPSNTARCMQRCGRASRRRRPCSAATGTAATRDMREPWSGTRALAPAANVRWRILPAVIRGGAPSCGRREGRSRGHEIPNVGTSGSLSEAFPLRPSRPPPRSGEEHEIGPPPRVLTMLATRSCSSWSSSRPSDALTCCSPADQQHEPQCRRQHRGVAAATN